VKGGRQCFHLPYLLTHRCVSKLTLAGRLCVLICNQLERVSRLGLGLDLGELPLHGWVNAFVQLMLDIISFRARLSWRELGVCSMREQTFFPVDPKFLSPWL